MSKIIAFLFLMVVTWDISAQSIKEDFKRLLGYYQDIQTLYIEMETNIHEGAKATQVRSTIRKNNNQFLYHLPDKSILVNNKYFIVVDKRNHNILYDSWSKANTESLANQHIPVPEDLLKKYPTINYKGEKENLKHYHLHNSKQQMSDVEIFFDGKTGQIKRCIYKYNKDLIGENVWMDVKFKVINTTPKFTDEMFSEKQFVKASGSKLIASSKYKGYSVYPMNRQ